MDSALNADPDRLLSYMTNQQVNVLDRKLGLTSYILQLIIVLYIVFYVFFYMEGYLAYEPAKGAISTLISGDAASTSTLGNVRYFSSDELTYPGLENGNVFVATNIRVTRQKLGFCEDRSRPCYSAKDCASDLGGVCNANKFCEEPSWCNDEAVQPEVFPIDSGDLMIWVKSSIQFQLLNPHRLFSTETGHAYPELGYNEFTVNDLLAATMQKLHFEDINQHGCAVEVQFIWNCNVNDDTCIPDVMARRVDVEMWPENHGFSFFKSELISETERNLEHISGVRLYFRTVGLGRKFSTAAIILRASLNSSLLALAAIITDFMMLKIFKHRKKYMARKYEESPDFSDYMDALKEKTAAEERFRQQQDEEDDKARSRDEEFQEQLDNF